MGPGFSRSRPLSHICNTSRFFVLKIRVSLHWYPLFPIPSRSLFRFTTSVACYLILQGGSSFLDPDGLPDWSVEWGDDPDLLR